MSPKVKEEDCAAANMAENADKNRDANILPADRHRPYLMIRVEGTNDYINAVFLDVRLYMQNFAVRNVISKRILFDMFI